MDEAFLFEVVVPAERRRLVNLCARLSGDRDAADDLAQETLLLAWRNAHKLQDPDQYWPWLVAIARNVCRHWLRRQYRERTHPLLAEASSPLAGVQLTDELPGTFDLELELERDELATLLDRALAMLPDDTRRVLVERYVNDAANTDIAARLGVTENVVAVRLHRGKLALQRVLTTHLREDAAAYGLAELESDAWQETRIWCTTCGQRRLLGRKDNSSLTLRCPDCCTDPEMNTAYDVSAERYGTIKAFRPAFSRLLGHASSYFRDAIARGHALCPSCQDALPLHSGLTPPVPLPLQHVLGIHVQCPRCGFCSDLTLDALVAALPDTQHFWRRHPRIRTLPAQQLEVDGHAAVLTRVESVVDTAHLDVISARDTFQLLGIHPSPAP